MSLDLLTYLMLKLNLLNKPLTFIEGNIGPYICEVDLDAIHMNLLHEVE